MRVKGTPRLRPRFRPTPRLPSVKVNVFCPICKRKGALFGGGRRRMVFILAISDAMIRLSEWRLKLVLSIPSVSIFAISIAKIRHPFGARIIRDN